MPTEQPIVLLDTNFLLLPYQFTVDIFGQLDQLVPGAGKVVPQGVIEELERISQGKGKDAAAARFAFFLLARQKIQLVPSEGRVDDWIVGYARLHRVVVCTNDGALRKRIKSLRGRTITLKGKARLGFD